MMQAYWPPGVQRVLTVEAFVCAYTSIGYVLCPPGTFEPEVGYEKVVIFTKNGVPTHAARSTPSGWWASKLGPNVDIEHELHALDGPEYGGPAIVLKRLVR
jgi:hypothetical protein